MALLAGVVRDIRWCSVFTEFMDMLRLFFAADKTESIRGKYAHQY